MSRGRAASALPLATLAVAALLLSACWRVREPPQIHEPVRVEVVGVSTRLPHAQAYLQRAIADTLVDRLGWDVGPHGSARLEVTIDRESIDTAARDPRGVPTRWSIRLAGTALLVSQHGNILHRFSGHGYATRLADEEEGLRAAADNAAFMLSCWLETETKKLR